ncbi:hypothetical protein ACTFIZ_006119 [Dictyostelium cf. discoideum]
MEFKKILLITIVFIEIVIGGNPIFIENNISLGKNLLQANYPVFDIPANYVTLFTLKIDDSIKNSDININIGSQKENDNDMILLQFNELNYVQGNTPFLVQLCTSSNEETFNITCLNNDNSDCKLSISVNASNSNSFCTQTLDTSIFDEFLKDFFNFGFPQLGEIVNENQQQQQQQQQPQQQQQQQEQQQEGQEGQERQEGQEGQQNQDSSDGELRPIIKSQQQNQPKLKISRFNDETSNWFNNFFKNNF